METVKGYVEHIVFRNEDNGYTVFRLDGDDGELTCVGKFSYIQEGELLELTGTYTVHKVYGTQLEVASSRLCAPEDLVSIKRYLGSGAIKGVGASLAGRIVDKFQEDTFRIIEEEPERLAEVKGISERMAREIAVQVEEEKDVRDAMIFLQKYGISTALAAKIYDYYGVRVYHIIEENPYDMADHVNGVGFRTADEIAAKVGISADSDYRIRSGILYTLQQSVGEGHIFLCKDGLIKRTGELLHIQIPSVEEDLMNLAMEKRIVLKDHPDGVRVYLASYYYMELRTAQMLHDLNLRFDVSDDDVRARLSQIEKETGLTLDPLQQQAVLEAAKSGITILTGGPGTGKTTTIQTLIHFFMGEGMDILLGAPTGRAAKRMTEATGYEAMTIHRMLEVNGNPEAEGEPKFTRNEENPLEADAIIIDEMSMVDLPLMSALLTAIVPGTRLVLVGDASQLPSVGPGSVLKDLIAAHAFPTVMLTHIFRQAGKSDIVVNAHKINRGEDIALDNQSQDFFFLKRDDADTIIRVILSLVRDKLPPYVHADPFDIQVLTPMRKGLLGVERLNQILQAYLNPSDPKKQERENFGRIFREGDKVMQIRNNYQLEWEVHTAKGLVVDQGSGIFNGDLGIIRTINEYEGTVTVEFDEHRQVSYPFASLEELELAYAITIHKAQGSEYPAVVIPLLSGPKQLFYRNLLYTAITRARQCVTLVGSEETIRGMIANTHEQERNTSLSERIRECM